MLKKIALLGVVAGLAISSAAFAGNSGLYFGAGLGYQNTNVQTSITSLTSPEDYTLTKGGAVGTIFAGYGFNFSNNMWLGLEANAELSGAKVSDNSTEPGSVSSNRYRVKGSFGLSVRPGYFVTSATQLYAVLGWQHTNFESTYAESSVQTYNIKRDQNGFRYGLGVGINLTRQVGMRAEWTQTRYKKKTDVVVPQAQSLLIRPLTNQFTISAVWTV